MSGVAEALNAHCFCTGLDSTRLDAELQATDLQALVRERCPHAFAQHPVFVAQAQLDRMAAVVQAMETVVALPAYREQALARAPAIARHNPAGAMGVFMGYDFHVDGDQLGLIEINTNAGGAMLNAVAQRAQRACCPGVQPFLPPAHAADDFEAAMVRMFQTEWTRAARALPLRTIAIVDEAPQAQYLFPEFELFRHLFVQHGLQAVVCDPSELAFADGVLRHQGLAIDLVYNRLTDFYLDDPRHAALRQAYLADQVVLTPHPQAHALYADKRNLVVLSDASALQTLGLPQSLATTLERAVPRTVALTADNAEALWRERRDWFFKPAAGYGSRAAYRGDKLTKGVWQNLLAAGDTMAQRIVRPGTRTLAEGQDALKFDLRNYAYAGQVQWVAARLYQGQTTNFRTPGGGFAPVVAVHQVLAEEPSLAASCM